MRLEVAEDEDAASRGAEVQRNTARPPCTPAPSGTSRAPSTPQASARPTDEQMADASPSARMKRRMWRETVVLDPCQETEQRRLLLEVLPQLQADRQSRVREHTSLPPPRVLLKGDRLQLRSESFLTITGMLGAGSYGTVWAAQPMVVNLGRRRQQQPPVVIKLSSPPQLWEWYIHTVLRKRLPTTTLNTRIVPAIEAHSWGDIDAAQYRNGTSLLVQPLASGTLTVLIEAHRAQRETVHELTAIFLAASLLRAVGALHQVPPQTFLHHHIPPHPTPTPPQADVLHADVRPDNIALRLGSPSSLIPEEPLTEG